MRGAQLQRWAAAAFLLFGFGSLGIEAQVPPCPWFAQGTAAALLGGKVDVTVQGNQSEGECVFTRRENAGEATLRISVRSPAHVQSGEQAANCMGDRTPLRGVGTEAFLCSIADGALVVGTVRGQELRVSISAPSKGVIAISPVEARNKAVRAAEQVAGSLF